MSIPSVTPRFSGFYEVNATEKELDSLPIGRAHDLPYFYANSISVQGTSWLYCLPNMDDRMKAALKGAELDYFDVPDQEIIERYTRPEDRPVAINNIETDFPLVKTLMQRWTNERIDQLMSDAIRRTFKF